VIGDDQQTSPTAAAATSRWTERSGSRSWRRCARADLQRSSRAVQHAARTQHDRGPAARPEHDGGHGQRVIEAPGRHHPVLPGASITRSRPVGCRSRCPPAAPVVAEVRVSRAACPVSTASSAFPVLASPRALRMCAAASPHPRAAPCESGPPPRTSGRPRDEVLPRAGTRWLTTYAPSWAGSAACAAPRPGSRGRADPPAAPRAAPTVAGRRELHAELSQGRAGQQQRLPHGVVQPTPRQHEHPTHLEMTAGRQVSLGVARVDRRIEASGGLPRSSTSASAAPPRGPRAPTRRRPRCDHTDGPAARSPSAPRRAGTTRRVFPCRGGRRQRCGGRVTVEVGHLRGQLEMGPPGVMR